MGKPKFSEDFKQDAVHQIVVRGYPVREALDLVARELGFAHWYEVSTASKNGWLPSSEQISKATNLLEKINPDAASMNENRNNISEMFGAPGGEERGYIDSHPYIIDASLDDVFMSGRGWLIRVGEAPSSKPIIEVSDRRYKNNPIHEPDFVARALEMANAKAEQVRARISSDWPRRSTKPDAQGQAAHPLNGKLSKAWYCLHCDTKSTAKMVASNLWHCPSCSASPIDIFHSPWWLDESPDNPNNSE